MTTTDTPRDKAPMGHIGLDVSHLERAKPFSQVILGCQVLGESPQEGRQ